MQPQDTKQWTDLDGIVASTTPLIPEVNRCSITRGSNETIDILLLPQGMFSLFVDPLAPMLRDELSNPLQLALGRVLVDYAVAQGKHDPATDDELQRLDSPEIEATPIYWRDLPDVTAVVGRGPERMMVTAFRSGSEVLGLFTARDTVVPIGWLHCPRATPNNQLLIALSRAFLRSDVMALLPSKKSNKRPAFANP